MKETLTTGLAAFDRKVDRLRRKLRDRWGSDDPLHVLAFRGFGTRERLWLRGRVLQAESVPELSEDDNVLDNVRNMLRRYETDEIADARLEARLGDRTFELTTDDEGYFELEVDSPETVAAPWTEIGLTLLSPEPRARDRARAVGRVRVPGERARIAIVSDMDDTVVKTGATEALRSTRTILTNNARSREPFPGVSAFYRALCDGPDGDRDNPIFYVSSSPWNLFDLFECFLELHDIPAGPILLKDFGLDRGKLLKSGHVEYKADRIGRVLETYPELGFVLLGDSGQKDAWVFERVVEEHPGRVTAAYLRDLDPDDPEPEIENIERTLSAHGVPMLRVRDTAQAAEHARSLGLISERQLDDVHQAVRDHGD